MSGVVVVVVVGDIVVVIEGLFDVADSSVLRIVGTGALGALNVGAVLR